MFIFLCAEIDGSYYKENKDSELRDILTRDLRRRILRIKSCFWVFVFLFFLLRGFSTHWTCIPAISKPFVDA